MSLLPLSSSYRILTITSQPSTIGADVKFERASIGMATREVCCGCHEERDIFVLRQGVRKCAECICTQIGRSTMDLFRKGIKPIPSPVHILVHVSGDASSVFLFHLVRARLTVTLQGKSAVIRKIEGISGTPQPDCHLIDRDTLPAITQWARDNGFHCVLEAGDASHIAVATLAAVTTGRTDLAHLLATDDFVNYAVPVLRPIRQCLAAETEFYCRHHALAFSEEPMVFERAFAHEKKMLEEVLADGHGATPFAVQKLAERISGGTGDEKCTECGLPVIAAGICEICSTIVALR
jgi:hypothetical protein